MTLIPKGWSLFTVDIEYTVPFEQVQAVLEPHMDFVRRAYAERRFLASGPKVPRTGGMVVMMAPSLEEAHDYLSADPFVTANVADVRITQFLPNNLHPALKA
ncbi:YciI family protein [Thalassovita sp.]|uniref:YciI family protein n=1 Tax=Thalassovita sp. TaxID=1979401 RepID=UPI0029DE733A|nr:YciI family protein [Thalassovita sp.]